MSNNIKRVLIVSGISGFSRIQGRASYSGLLKASSYPLSFFLFILSMTVNNRILPKMLLLCGFASYIKKMVQTPLTFWGSSCCLILFTMSAPLYAEVPQGKALCPARFDQLRIKPRDGEAILINGQSNGNTHTLPLKGQFDIARNLSAAADDKEEEMLVIACDRDFPPYTMLNFEGAPAGMFIDIWRLWAAKTRQKIKFRFTNWGDTIVALKNGEVDIHSGLFKNEERSAFMDFSLSFYESTSAIFYPAKYGKILSLEDLNGQKVGAILGGETSNYLRKHAPGLKVITFREPKEMIKAALGGEIRACADEAYGFQTFLRHLGRASDFRRLDKRLYSKKFSAAVKKGRNGLIDKINAGFRAISNEEFIEIESSWIPFPEARYFKSSTGLIKFTVAEKAWLRAHKRIRIGVDPDFPPFEFIGKDESYLGIASEYVRLLGIRLGLQMEVTHGLSWSEVVAKGKAREIDLYPCVGATPERETYMTFTKAYLRYPMVILTQTKTPFIGGLPVLRGKKVAVVRDYISYDYLQRNHPDIEIHLVDSPKRGLAAVSSGAAYAFVGNLATATYLISKHGFLNLKVAASTPYHYDLSFAVRSDWPELISLIIKGLDTITAQERGDIYQKWLTLRFEHEVKTARLWRIALKIGGLATIIIVVVFLWNMQIQRREKRFRGLTEHGMDITQAFTEKGTIVYQSPSHAHLLGYDDNELLGRSVYDLFHKQDLPEWRRTLDALMRDEGVQSFIHRLRHKNGQYRYFETNCINMIANKALKALVINARDVTDRKQAENALQKAHVELEQRVRDRTAELTAINKKLNSEIEEHKQSKSRIIEYQESLRSLTSELSLAEERERRNIAVDLHDHVCQTLAICQIKLGTLQKETAFNKSPGLLNEAIRLCQSAIADTRSLIFEISPPALYELGLEAALDELIELMQKDYTITAIFEDDGEPKSLVQEVQVTLYRAVRELLMNVIKHAQARCVKVTVRRKGHNLRIEVVDDGVGFDTSKLFFNSIQNKSFGLLNIRERLELLGGQMEIQSEAGRGTTAILTAPLESDQFISETEESQSTKKIS